MSLIPSFTFFLYIFFPVFPSLHQQNVIAQGGIRNFRKRNLYQTALLQVQIRDRVSASLSCLLDRFTAVTVCLCQSVLKMAASFKLFERFLDLNAWNKYLSTLSVSVRFNRHSPDTHWTMILLSQDVSFSRHFKLKDLQLDCCNDSKLVSLVILRVDFFFFFLWKCQTNAQIIKHVKLNKTKLPLKGFTALQTLLFSLGKCSVLHAACWHYLGMR